MGTQTPWGPRYNGTFISRTPVGPTLFSVLERCSYCTFWDENICSVFRGVHFIEVCVDGGSTASSMIRQGKCSLTLKSKTFRTIFTPCNECTKRNFQER